jgi:hypothetical protein
METLVISGSMVIADMLLVCYTVNFSVGKTYFSPTSIYNFYRILGNLKIKSISI